MTDVSEKVYSLSRVQAAPVPIPPLDQAAPFPAEMFQHDYDLDSLLLVHPRGHNFSMYVTPRFLHHYEKEDFEGYTARLVRALLRRCQLFVDVGANYGFYTLLAATRYPDLKVLALEPVPENFAVLSRNSKEYPNVALHQVAAADTDGTGTLHISMAADNCSFYPHPATPTLRQSKVRTTRLDTLLAKQDPVRALVKIDVDGHEMAILRGMEGVFSRFPDLSLIVELNPKMQMAAGYQPEALLHELQRLGFAIFLLDDQRGRPVPLGAKSDWSSVVPRGSFANLYCVRKAAALNVCLFSHSSLLTGAEQSLSGLAKELVEDYGAVCSVVLPGDGPLRGLLEQAGAACIAAKYGWWASASKDEAAGGFARLESQLHDVLADVLPEIARISPDVIWTQTLVIPWGAVCAGLLGKPHVWAACEHGEHEGLHFFAPFPEVVSDVLSCSNLIYAASRSLAEMVFPEADAARCRVLYRHINIPEQTGDSPSSGIFQRKNAIRLGMFATMCKAKGQEDALRAVAQLVAEGRDIELLLAGHSTPEFRSHLERLVSHLGLRAQVRLSSFIDDRFPVMRETDVILVCSQQEAFGRVVVEGMLLGKPVVYSDVGGPAEFMLDGRTGLSYPCGDVPALARAIASLLADPAKRMSLGAEARNYARHKFVRENYGGEAYRTLLRVKNERALSPCPALMQPFLLSAMGLAAGAAAAKHEAGELRLRLDRMNARLARFARKLEAAEADNYQLSCALDSADKWQQDWLVRTFHRWRRPGAGHEDIGLFRKLERSVRKRRKRLLGRLHSNGDGTAATLVPGFVPSQRYAAAAAFAPLVTVIVPNYNHASYLRQRLESIYSQSYRHFKVLLLDDGSSDGSRAILEEYAAAWSDRTEVILNSTNGGAPFAQWKKGLELARTELVWIAESDDYCEPEFLEKLVPYFRDEAVQIAYARTVFVGSEGDAAGFSFEQYAGALDASKWTRSYVETAHREVRAALSMRNTIPNVSAAVLRHPGTLPLLSDPGWTKMRICGDWLFYLHHLRGGKIAYERAAASYYRFHPANASRATYKSPDYFREHEIVAQAIARLYRVEDACFDKQWMFLRQHYDHVFKDTPPPAWKIDELYDLGRIKAESARRLPNILMASYDFATGGGEVFPIRLAAALREHGFGVTFFDFAGQPLNPEFRAMLPRGIPVIERPANPPALERLVEDFGIEVVHTHHGCTDDYFASHMPLNGSRPRHVVTMHGMYEATDFSADPHRLHRLMRDIDYWIYTAEKNLAPFRRENLVAEERFCAGRLGMRPPAPVPVKRETLGIPEDAFVLCVVSRALPEKGWLESIRAVELARSQVNREIHLVLIGAGPVYDSLRVQGVPAFVHLLGFKNNPVDYYAMSDCGLLATRFASESCPFSIIECLMAGKPVLATDAGQIREMLTAPNGQLAGQVIPLCNGEIQIDAFASAIVRLATAPDFYHQICDNVEAVAERFDITNIVQQYAEVYSKVLAT